MFQYLNFSWNDDTTVNLQTIKCQFIIDFWTIQGLTINTTIAIIETDYSFIHIYLDI